MIDSGALYEDLTAAGLPVLSVNSDGRIDYSRDLTPTEQTTAQAVIAAHDPTKLSPDQQRAARAAAALESLGAADYKAWRTGVENATTQAQLKARLLNLGLVVWKLLQAQGLTDTADLEE